MMKRNRQRGVALFTAIFLVAVIALVAITVALTTTTQQIGAARALEAERAYYAAMARIEMTIPDILDQQDCTGTGQQQIAGFDTELSCSRSEATEAGQTYGIYLITARASRGDLQSGTLVRRSIRTQFTDL